jgi:hypothetical protein
MAVVALPAYAQEAETIEISTFEELCLIGVDDGYPLDGDYLLVDDIDASDSRDLDDGYGFLPIGKRRVLVAGGFGEPDLVDSALAFTGTFDGGGHTISGLYINRTASDIGANMGLFGFALGARITDLTVEAGTVAGYRYVGALVGRQSGGAVEGCAALGSVSGEADVGGLVGMVEGRGAVRACYSLADVGGGEVISVGGLVGSVDGSEVVECYSAGSVAVESGRNVGGLAGALYSIAKVRNSYSVAEVIGEEADMVGGLVGSNEGEVKQCYFAGLLYGAGNSVGGLIGAQTEGFGSALYSFWDTERSGCDSSAGGVGVSGKTTEQMMSASTMNLVAADTAAWGISNNYPYLKNKAFPRYTATVTAGPGGTLSGVTTAGGTVHKQVVNHWIAGIPIEAMSSPDSIVDKLDGWYPADSDEALEVGSYDGDGFTVEISEDGKKLSISNLTADVAIEARFVLKTLTLKYVAMGGNRGKVVPHSEDSTGEYSGDTLTLRAEYGDVVSVTTVPNAGYKFLQWYEEKSGEKSKDTIWTDTARSNRVISAFFITDTVTMTYTADAQFGRLRIGNASSGVQSHVAKLPYGGKGPSVEAVPNLYSTYQFVKWSDGRTDNPRIDTAMVETLEVSAIFEEVIAVKSPERTIPTLPTNETAQIGPVKITTSGLTAGPNPILRQNGGVNLYWQGTGITKGTLLIFDAAGNFVNKITVNSNNSIDKRPIATWTLTNAKGKPVGVGTYLIKGTLSTKNGSNEKVTLILQLI